LRVGNFFGELYKYTELQRIGVSLGCPVQLNFISVPLIQGGHPGYFVHVSIATPVVSAVKNYYIKSFLQAPTIFKPLLDPGGGLRSETAKILTAICLTEIPERT
jgi:hypothetical protein